MERDAHAHGYTAYTGNYILPQAGAKRFDIKNQKRVLILKQYTDNKSDFVSLETLTGIKRSQNQILELMKNRKTTLIPKAFGQYNSITTLTHEFGHVWGLCDMYALKGGKTNCDPDHSTVDHDHRVVLVDESIMSKAKGIDDLFLSDDDISGIKKLDRRVDLDQIEWSQLEPAPEYGEDIIPLSERYNFEVKSIEEKQSQIDLKVGIYSMKGFKINILEKKSGNVNFRKNLFF